MSNRILLKSVIPYIEGGNYGDTLVWDNSKQYGLDNKPLGRTASQQSFSTTGSGVSAGTSTAYTVALASTRSANTPGDTVAFKPHVTNGSTPTLAVGGAPALPILVNGVAPSSTAMVTTKIYYGITDGVSWDLR